MSKIYLPSKSALIRAPAEEATLGMGTGLSVDIGTSPWLDSPTSLGSVRTRHHSG